LDPPPPRPRGRARHRRRRREPSRAWDTADERLGSRRLDPQPQEEPMLKDFRAFILRGNVVDLAVGVVIGAAFGAVVAALVADFITPLIAAIGGNRDFSNLAF